MNDNITITVYETTPHNFKMVANTGVVLYEFVEYRNGYVLDTIRAWISNLDIHVNLVIRRIE